jgi:putative hemolysin
MTPRPDIVAIDIDADHQESWQKIAKNGYSQFPVYRDDPDNVLGIVSIKSLWAKLVIGEPIDLPSLLTRPLFVPEGLPARTMLENFRQSRVTIALVIDEYGSIQGIITLHDLLEATVGDLPSVEEATDTGIVQREDGSWLVDALLPVEKFMDMTGIDVLLEEENRRYHTIGGFMLLHFGRMPLTGSYFDWEGWRFEVVDMDGHRIDKVLVQPLGDIKDDGQETS